MSSAADRSSFEGLLIGLGHAERQDDGVGPFVAEALRRRGFPAVVHGGDGTALLDAWDNQPVCVVVDAMAAPDSEPGTLRVFTEFQDPEFQRAGFVHSTHRLGLPEAVALGRALGRLPGRLVVIGIAGAAFDFGPCLSPAVAATAAQLVERLADRGFSFDPDAL
ncbi:hydrogenase maturation protease [Pelagibius sp.]|uniref:hydrogenase maturation protease n=1 Tax=Pelagibius sp. TaxID=1931238 RepID=UPI003B50C89D